MRSRPERARVFRCCDHRNRARSLRTEGKVYLCVTPTGRAVVDPSHLTAGCTHLNPMPMRKERRLAMRRMLKPWTQIAWSHAPHALVPQASSRSTRIRRQCHSGLHDYLHFTVEFPYAQSDLIELIERYEKSVCGRRQKKSRLTMALKLPLKRSRL